MSNFVPVVIPEITSVTVESTKGVVEFDDLNDAADWCHEHQPSHATLQVAFFGWGLTIDLSDEFEVEHRWEARSLFKHALERELEAL